MGSEELAHVTAAVLILFVVLGFGFAMEGNVEMLLIALASAFVLVLVHVYTKKAMAYFLDAGVEHRIWHFYRYGFKAHSHFKKPRAFGLFVPLFFSVFSLGYFKLMTLLTYETKALKHRAAKRHGPYSFTEMTDWDHGLIGGAGIVGVLIISIVSYVIGIEFLARMAGYYALANLLPLSDLDGTYIFFGSKVIWTVLAAISLLFAFTGFALSFV